MAAQFGAGLHALARYTEPDRWWTRLALTRGAEVWLLTWLPGQGTEPHDHGGAAGSFTVLTGSVSEVHRYPGGPIRTRTFHAGHGIGFGGDRAHIVRNTGTAPASTIHAYSPPSLPTGSIRAWRKSDEDRGPYRSPSGRISTTPPKAGPPAAGR